MMSKGSKTPTKYPLGAALLYIRGARQNLHESLNSNDPELIWIRRKELSVILERVGEIQNKKSICESLVAFHLIRNIEIEIKIATVMLSDASSYLSDTLSLV